MQVSGSGVVTESGPQMQYAINVSRRKISDAWKLLGEIIEVRDNRAHLSLLQHYLRQPNSVRGFVNLPWQMFSAVFIKPSQYFV